MTPPNGMPSLLELKELCVELGSPPEPILKQVSFKIEAGQRLALLGPSGCGKTTTLRSVAGFERLKSGQITLSGQVLSDGKFHLPPHKRQVGLVFQDFALFPHLSVEENVGFGLPKRERQIRVQEMLRLVGLESLGKRKPDQISGGQQQRAALARALAPNPKLLLLDEPFSSLDANLRATTRKHTAEILRSVGAAALLVTHDQAEALTFADQIVLMHQGNIEQVGSPEELYQTPKNAFVAQFLGSANLLPAQADGNYAECALGRLELKAPAHGEVQVCLRPEALRLLEPGERSVASQALSATILERQYHGASSVYQVLLGDQKLVVNQPGISRWNFNDRVSLEVIAPACALSP